MKRFGLALIFLAAMVLPAQAAANDCYVVNIAPSLNDKDHFPCTLDNQGNLRVTGNFGTITVSGADGATLDGVNPAIKATVLDLTNSNPLTTAIVDASGNQITSFGGGTEYTEDAAAAANPVGKMGICRRKDTLSAAEVSADGDNIACNATSKGELYVKQTDPVTVTDGAGALNVIVDSGTTAATQSGTWNITNISGTVSLPTGAAQDSTLTGGTQKAIIRGGAKGGTSATDVTSTASGANHQPLDVVIYDTSGNAITSFGGSGGTSSSFGSAFPTPGTAAGFTDGTNMVAGRVVTSAPGSSDAGLVVRPISPASSTVGSAVPSVGVQVTGSDGTNARVIKTDTSGNTVVVQPTGTNLHVVCDSGCSSSAGFADNGAFTFGTTTVNPIAGVLDDTSTNAATENSAAIARITAQKALHMNLRNVSGTEIGTSSNPVRTDPTGTTTQPVSGTVSITANSAVNMAQVNGSTTQVATNSMNTTGAGLQASALSAQCDDTTPTSLTENQFGNVRMNCTDHSLKVDQQSIAGNTISTGNGTSGTGVQRVTIASDSTGTVAATQATASNLNVRPDTSGATGSAPPARANYVGGLSSGATGGLLSGFAVCDSYVNVSVSSATTTLLITGVASRNVHICSMSLVAAAADNVALISGTGATCGTGTTGMNGGTTAASGWNFAANGGITQGNGLGTINQTNAAGDSVCIVTSSTAQLSGRIAYAIY